MLGIPKWVQAATPAEEAKKIERKFKDRKTPEAMRTKEDLLSKVAEKQEMVKQMMEPETPAVPLDQMPNQMANGGAIADTLTQTGLGVAGTVIGGPIGGMIGGALGQIAGPMVGGLFGQNQVNEDINNNALATNMSQMAYGGMTDPIGKKTKTKPPTKINPYDALEASMTGIQQPNLNLGPYATAGYLDVQNQGTNYIVSPTGKNPQNYQGFQQQLKTLQKLNPNAIIEPNYLQFQNRMGYGGKTNSYPDGGFPNIMPYINNLAKFQGDPSYPPSVYSNQEMRGIQLPKVPRVTMDTGAGIPPSVFSTFEIGDGLNLTPPPAYPEITPNAFSPQGVSLKNRFAGTPSVVGQMERDGWRGNPIVDTGASMPPGVFSKQEGSLLPRQNFIRPGIKPPVVSQGKTNTNISSAPIAPSTPVPTVKRENTPNLINYAGTMPAATMSSLKGTTMPQSVGDEAKKNAPGMKKSNSSGLGEVMPYLAQAGRLAPLLGNLFNPIKQAPPVRRERIIGNNNLGRIDQNFIVNQANQATANAANMMRANSGGDSARLYSGLVGATRAGAAGASSGAYQAQAGNIDLNLKENQLNQRQALSNQAMGNYDTIDNMANFGNTQSLRQAKLNAILNSIGSLGKETSDKELVKEIYGYTWDGKFVRDKQGNIVAMFGSYLNK